MPIKLLVSYRFLFNSETFFERRIAGCSGRLAQFVMLVAIGAGDLGFDYRAGQIGHSDRQRLAIPRSFFEAV